jgi:hypothetical protein
MHTKTEMLSIIKRYTKQYRVAFCADDVIWGYVQTALDSVVEKLVSGADNRGHRILLKYTAGADVDTATEFYDFPVDSLLVNEVHIKGATDDEWSMVAFAPELDIAVNYGVGVGCVGYVGGSSLWLAGCGLSNVFWGVDDASGSMRLVGADGLGGYKYRYRYLFKPVLPSVDGGTFNDPTSSGSDVNSLPDSFCSCVEYLAASLLLMEDEENEKPIRNYGDLYAMSFSTMVGVVRKKVVPLYFGGGR